jgi:hypothetical protein
MRLIVAIVLLAGSARADRGDTWIGGGGALGAFEEEVSYSAFLESTVHVREMPQWLWFHGMASVGGLADIDLHLDSDYYVRAIAGVELRKSIAFLDLDAGYEAGGVSFVPEGGSSQLEADYRGLAFVSRLGIGGSLCRAAIELGWTHAHHRETDHGPGGSTHSLGVRWDASFGLSLSFGYGFD